SRQYLQQLTHERHDLADAHPPSASFPTGIERLAVEEVHDDEDGAVLGGVVVEHSHRSGVADAVRRVALTEETGPETGVDRELPVEDLHSDDVRVPKVGRRVDAGHAADAENAIQAVLSAEDRAYARLRSVTQVVVRHRHRSPQASPRPSGPAGQNTSHHYVFLRPSRRDGPGWCDATTRTGSCSTWADASRRSVVRRGSRSKRSQRNSKRRCSGSSRSSTART